MSVRIHPKHASIRGVIPIANGVGSSLLGIYRIIAGVSIALSLIFLFHLNEEGSLKTFGMLIFTSFAFLAMSYFLSKCHDYANKKQQVGS